MPALTLLPRITPFADPHSELQANFRIVAARCARALRRLPPSRETRGRRESRVRAAPAVSCALRIAKNAHEHTGSAETLRPSLRNGFTAYSVLSPVSGLSCHRRRRDTSRQLSASVAAPGPHGFAVRDALRSSFASFASTASHRAFRDDREAPLSSGETPKAKH
jgi:hypothetical protein